MHSMKNNMAWQDVVAEKRRIRSETIARLASAPETMTTDQIGRHDIEATDVTKGNEIVNHLASRRSTCEAFINSFIQR